MRLLGERPPRILRIDGPDGSGKTRSLMRLAAERCVAGDRVVLSLPLFFDSTLSQFRAVAGDLLQDGLVFCEPPLIARRPEGGTLHLHGWMSGLLPEQAGIPWHDVLAIDNMAGMPDGFAMRKAPRFVRTLVVAGGLPDGMTPDLVIPPGPLSAHERLALGSFFAGA